MTTSLKYSKRIFIMFVLSYLFVLMIPIGMGSIAYVKAGRVIEEEVGNSNMNMLKLICSDVDSRLAEIEHMVSQISVNYRVTKYLSTGVPLTSEDRYQAASIIKDFEPYSGKNSFVKDFFIYFNNSDTIITSTSTYDPELFYKYLYSHRDVPFEKWHEDVKNPKSMYQELLSGDMIVNGKNQRMIMYKQSLPITETESPSGLLVVLIQEDKIREFLEDVSMGGCACIVDKSDNIIMSAGDDNICSLLDHNWLTSQEGMVYSNVDGQEVVIAYMKSQKVGWTYVSIIPRSVFMQKLDYVKNITMWIAGICLVIGVLAACLLANRNYSPIRHIADALVHLRGDLPAKGRNEFDYIRESVLSAFKKNVQLEQTVKDLITKNEKVNEIINRNKKMVKTSLIVSLIKGRVDDFEAIKSWLSFYDVVFPYSKFVVIIFHIDDCSHFMKDNDEDDWHLIRFVVTSVAEELANENNKGYAVELERDTIALVLNISDQTKPAQAKDFVVQITNRIKVFISEHFETVISIAIGGVQEGIDKVAQSYKQAEQAMDYKIIKGVSSVINSDEIVDEDKDYYYPIASELKLINFVKTGDIKKCERLLKNIFKENFDKRKLQLKVAKCLFFDIMSTAIKVLDAISVKYSDIFEVDFDPVDELVSCETVDEMYNEILSIYGKICEYVNLRKNRHNTELMELVINFINKNYVKKELSQTMIADSLGISAPYLSKLFKRETGKYMVDYINGLRIEKAKILLLNTSQSIEEIAWQVGYSSSKTLIRIFKQHEGVTPGKYRNSI